MSDDPKARLAELRARLADVAKADAVVDEFMRQCRRYCGAHGIQLSVFLQWPADDVACALQYQREQDALCPGCGQPRAESFDGKSRYVVEAHRCDACAGLGQKSWLAQKNRSKHSVPQFGVYHTVKKVG